VPKRIFAVLYVSGMGLTRCYKTTVFLHLYSSTPNFTSIGMQCGSHGAKQKTRI